MEQNSQIEILESQIRDIWARVVWSHKTQEKCADNCTKWNNIIKWSQVILSTIITTSIFIALFGKGQISLILGAITSTILLSLNAYTKDHNLGEIAQKHANTAKELLTIREEYLSLLTDIKSDLLSVDKIINKRDELQSKLNEIYKDAPRTNKKCYKEATKTLKFNEELTFTDEEIDFLLPKALRKKLIG